MGSNLQPSSSAITSRHRLGFSARAYTIRWGQVRCGAVRCGAVRCGAARCGAVRCGAARRGVGLGGVGRAGGVERVGWSAPLLLHAAHKARKGAATSERLLLYLAGGGTAQGWRTAASEHGAPCYCSLWPASDSKARTAFAGHPPTKTHALNPIAIAKERG